MARSPASRAAQSRQPRLALGLQFGLTSLICLSPGFGLLGLKPSVFQHRRDLLLARGDHLGDGSIQETLKQSYQNQKVDDLGGDGESVDLHGYWPTTAMK